MKILITGASGFLGTRILRFYHNKYECLAPGHSQMDIIDESSCIHILRQTAPDYVIHTAAISDTGTCEARPELSYKTNVTGAINLAKACAKTNCRLIFMSSDQVYNGSRKDGPNQEQDVCCPITVYGRQKLEAEEQIMKILPDSIALRLTWLYDLPTSQLGAKDNFLTKILDALENNQSISCSDKEYRGITYVSEVVRYMEALFDIPPFPHAAPRNLVMDQGKLNQWGIRFCKNQEGIFNCLTEHVRIKDT